MTEPYNIDAHELLDLILEDSTTMFSIITLQGDVIFANKAAIGLFRKNPDVPTKNIFELLGQTERNIFKQLLNELKVKKNINDTISAYDKNGTKRTLNFFAKLIEKENKSFIQIVAHDITQIQDTNKKLQDANKTYQHILQHSPETITICDVSGNIIDCNETVVQEYGYSKQELLQKNIKDLCVENDKPKIKEALENAYHKAPQKIEIRLKTKDGKVVYREKFIRKGDYFDKSVLIISGKDTTEWKKKELEFSKNNYELLATISVNKEVASSPNYKEGLKKALDKILEITLIKSGCVYESAENRTDYIMFYNKNTPSDISRNIQSISLKETPYNELKQQEHGFLLLECTNCPEHQYRLILPFFSYSEHPEALFFLIDDKPFENHTVSLLQFILNELKHFVNTKLLREQLIETESKYKTLLDSAKVAIMLIENGLIVECNPKTLELFELPENEIIGKSIFQLLPSTLPNNRLAEQKIYETGEIKTLEWSFIKKNKQSFYCEMSFNQISLQNKLYNLAIVRDITEKKLAEIALSENESKFKILANNSPVLMKMTNANNYFNYFNETWLTFTGSNIKQNEQNGWIDFIHPEDLNTVLLTLDTAFKKRKKFEITYRLKKATGEYRWILENGVPYLDNEGRFKGYIASGIDITERKIAEEEIRRQELTREMEQQLQSAMKKADLVAVNLDVNGKIIYCNEFFKKITGWTDQEVIGKNWFDFLINTSTNDRVSLLNLMKNGNIINLQRGIRTKKGTQKILQFSVMILSTNGKEMPHYTIIGEDITQQIEQEKALKKSEEKFRNIFESFLDIYFRTDRKGFITMISPSIYEVCGYTPEEMIGKQLSSFYIYNIRSKRSLQVLRRKGFIRNFEVPLIDKKGNILDFIINIRLIKENGEVIGTEGVARDVTELKRITKEALKAKEIAEKSLKVKEQFLANMSHEIRTPMNGIIGMIDVLSETNLQEKQAEYVNTIKKSSETLLNILNDILDISKIEAGKMKLRKQTVNLTETLEKLTTLFAQKAEEKGITLNYHIDRKIPKYIEADETRLLQILSNLTSNAIKFTEQGGVSIQVRLKEQTENNLIIQCNVTDTGIGISAEDKNFLFDYFSQLDNSTTKIYGGTGLGLAISKQLCHMMQGDIWVDSEEGKGSTFSFTFKTKAVRPKKKSAETDETNNAFTTFEINQQPELLLVDDNAINQKVASEILLRANCKITTAFSGKKAIELIKNKTFDLIFMDIQMPEMDGITAAQHIKALLKEKTPPIIAMTAYSMSEDREKFITAGMDDYLAKPIKAQQLLAKVKEWVCQTQKSKKTTRTEQSTKNTVLAEKQIKNYIIFDQETIKNLQEMIGKEMLLETLQDFEKETKVILENCSKALQINDYETIKHELHTLKGTAGTLGIITISHLAFETEQLLKSKEQTPNTNEVISKINDLKQAFQQFCEQYTEIIV